LGIQEIRVVEQRRIVDEIPSAFEEDDDEVLIMEDDDRLVGESEQGEAVYEDRESGDRYEER
jgi:hypothetical protein